MTLKTHSRFHLFITIGFICSEHQTCFTIMDLPGNYWSVPDPSYCPGPAPVTLWGYCRMDTIPRVPWHICPLVPVCQPLWISQAHVTLSTLFPDFWLLAQPCIKDLVFNSCLLSVPSPDKMFWVLDEFYTNPKWPLHADCWSSPLFLLILRESSVNSQHPGSGQYSMDERGPTVLSLNSEEVTGHPIHLDLAKQSLMWAVCTCAAAWMTHITLKMLLLKFSSNK